MNKPFVYIFFALLFSTAIVDLALNKLGVGYKGRPDRKDQRTFHIDRILKSHSFSEIESFFLANSHLTHSIAPIYNEINFKLFKKVNAQNYVGENNRFFVTTRVRTYSGSNYESFVSDSSLKLSGYLNKLSQRGNVTLLLIPDVARIYPEEIYYNAVIPGLKDNFLQKVVLNLPENVSKKNLTDEFKSAKDEINVYFKADHHYTYKMAERIASSVISETTGTPPYNIKWKEELGKDSLLRTSNFIRRSRLEKKIQGKEPTPNFNPIEKSFSSLKPCFVYLTSSFGLYGLGEFMEQRLGCPGLKLIGNGKGSFWAPDEFLLNHTELNNLPIYWEIAEYHLYTASEQ